MIKNVNSISLLWSYYEVCRMIKIFLTKDTRVCEIRTNFFVIILFMMWVQQGSGFVETTKGIKILLSGNLGMSSTKFLHRFLKTYKITFDVQARWYKMLLYLEIKGCR